MIAGSSIESNISWNAISWHAKFGILGNRDEILNGRLAPIFVAELIVAQDLPRHPDMASLLGIFVLLEKNAFASRVMGTLFRAERNSIAVPCSVLWLTAGHL